MRQLLSSRVTEPNVNGAVVARAQRLYRQYPFVMVRGPERSGKRALCKAAFPGLPPVKLADPAVAEKANGNPQAFLRGLPGGAVLSDIYDAGPALLSYLQVLADETRRNGLFVFTSSADPLFVPGAYPTLAGRVASVTLLFPSLAQQAPVESPGAVLGFFHSGTPDGDSRTREGDIGRLLRRVNGGGTPPPELERFVRLCAVRTGHEFDVASLADCTGVGVRTARGWFEALQRCYIVWLLQPWIPTRHTRLRVRASPGRLFFYDLSLVCRLLGIDTPSQVASHPARLGLLRNAAVLELVSHDLNRGNRPTVSFFHHPSGARCVFWDTGNGVVALDCEWVPYDEPGAFRRDNPVLPFRRSFLGYVRELVDDVVATVTVRNSTAERTDLQTGEYVRWVGNISGLLVSLGLEPPPATRRDA